MARPDWVTVVALTVVLVLLGTGPLTGVDVTSAQTTSFGDGDATVASATVDTSALAITAGRFGAADAYLRLPTATVTVDSVTDRPRLIYIVTVPELDIQRVETKVLTGSGTYRLAPDDRALSPDTPAGPYEATVTVRIQSYTTDRTVSSETVTVEAA